MVPDLINDWKEIIRLYRHLLLAVAHSKTEEGEIKITGCLLSGLVPTMQHDSGFVAGVILRYQENLSN